MLNFQNDDNLVHVDSMLVKAENICFKSANEIISVRISENNGPEFVCADGTHVIFASYSQYYAFISCKGEKVFDPDTQMLDIKKMNDFYLTKEDDAVDVIYRNQEVYRVGLYNIPEHPAPIYKFYTNNV